MLSSTFITFFILFLCKESTKADYIINHRSVDNFDLMLNFKYDTSCSQSTDFSLIVNVPRRSSLLNVLETANQNYPILNGFKVFYLSNQGYFIVSINNEGGGSSSCQWTVSTVPVTIQSINEPLDQAFVTSNGMTVTFHYTTTSFASFDDFISKMSNGTIIPASKVIPATFSYGATGSIEYAVTYSPSGPCVNPHQQGSIPSSMITVDFTLGESAVNIMEKAANMAPANNFILSNFVGMYYFLEVLDTVSVDENCLWCHYYTPDSNTVTPYLLTADLNNFIIPLPTATSKLSMEYKESCGSASFDSFVRMVDKVIDKDVPPHFNPFVQNGFVVDGGRQSDSGHCNVKDI